MVRLPSVSQTASLPRQMEGTRRLLVLGLEALELV